MSNQSPPEKPEKNSTSSLESVGAEIQETVMSDGHASLGFWWSKNFEERAFGLVMSDGGGYSFLWLRPQEWEEIKKKVDALIGKHVKS